MTTENENRALQEGSQPQPANTPSTHDAARLRLIAKANAGDPVAAIEVIRTTVAEATEPPGIARFRLSPPKRVLFTGVPRSLADVDESVCRAFAELCAGERPWPLFLYGGVGSGKTLAALSFCDLLRGNVSYETLEDACGEVMAGERPWRSQGQMLILDEIGERSKIGDLHYTTLKATLDWREFHFRRVGMYISNLAPDALVELFDDRIVSRLTCGTVCRLNGGDRRHEQ